MIAKHIRVARKFRGKDGRWPCRCKYAYATTASGETRIDTITLSELDVLDPRYFANEEPVVVKGAVAGWPAVKKWKDLQWLKDSFGHHMVPVEVGKNYVDSEQHHIPFGAYLDYVSKKETNLDTGELPSLYLAQYDLLDQIPELKEDVIPPYQEQEDDDTMSDIGTQDEFGNLINRLGKGDLYSTNSWVSGARTASNTHRDPLHNIFCQIVGTKYFRIFFPDNEADMYPNHSVFNSNTSRIEKFFHAVHLDKGSSSEARKSTDTHFEYTNYSQEELDRDGFSNFYNVKYKDCFLSPGDVLYIPKRRWHYALSTDVSISVNYWFL